MQQRFVEISYRSQRVALVPYKNVAGTELVAIAHQKPLEDGSFWNISRFSLTPDEARRVGLALLEVVEDEMAEEVQPETAAPPETVADGSPAQEGQAMTGAPEGDTKAASGETKPSPGDTGSPDGETPHDCSGPREEAVCSVPTA